MLAVAYSLLFTTVAGAQCAFTFAGTTNYTTSINFTPLGTAPPNVPASSLNDAIDFWGNGCPDFGSAFPTLTEGPYNAGTNRLNVYIIWQQGRSPDRCGAAQVQVSEATGEIVGATINMYPQQANGVDCTQNWVNIIAHEIGHVLGLSDVYNDPSCNGTIMGNSPTFISDDQCSMVNANWYTMSEWERDTQMAQDESYCQAYGCSPIIIDLGGDGYQFTSPEEGVLFDIDADGRLEKLAWTAAGTDIAFLALDRNGNRIIDDASELFGDHTPLAGGATAWNGFEALKQFDENGDGHIDADDPVWNRLLLWTDRNHDGLSQTNELTRASTAVVSLGLKYQEIGKSDRHGNRLRFQAKVQLRAAREKAKSSHYYDVFFVPAH